MQLVGMLVMVLMQSKPRGTDDPIRVRLNALTLEFWMNWTAMCIEAGVDVEKQWYIQRNYLYDLFYRGCGYERKRPINRKNHRRPKADLEFTETWKDYQKNQ